MRCKPAKNKMKLSQKTYRVFLFFLSALVVFSVFYQLMLPGITMTKDPSPAGIQYTVCMNSNSAREFTSVDFTVSNAGKGKTGTLYYSDDGGETWTVTPFSEAVTGNKDLIITYTPSASESLDRMYKIILTNADGESVSESDPLNLLFHAKEENRGFSDWLESGFPGKATKWQELSRANGQYYGAIKARLSHSGSEDGGVTLTASFEQGMKYWVNWQYKDRTGNWVPLGSVHLRDNKQVSAQLKVNKTLSEYKDPDGGVDIRCWLTSASSTHPQNDPSVTVYGLSNNLVYSAQDLSNIEILDEIKAVTGKDVSMSNLTSLYYGNVGPDTRVPFSDAESFSDCLIKAYQKGGKDAVNNLWNRYINDMFDPNYNLKSKPYGVANAYDNYGDSNLIWPKDSTTPFHDSAFKGIIEDLDYDQLEDGVNYSDFIGSLKKTAQAVLPGDENENREYDIDIAAGAHAGTLTPMAFIFQVQTSWQMFDLKHANALVGDGATEKGACANNTELANLYAIKNAIIRFAEYIQSYNSTSVAIGITNTQHGGSHNMVTNGESLVTNNMENLIHALYAWDSFGDCEHVHYDTNALNAAVADLKGDLANWKDASGNPLTIEDIKKEVIIIGGPTENTKSTNGYACSLPWATFTKNSMDGVFGIRINEGTPLNPDNLISWIDYAANNGGTPYSKTGGGNQFTSKYVATSEDAIFNSLVDIFKSEQNRVDNDGIFVENTVIRDVVQNEFTLLRDTVQIVTVDSDGNKTVSPADPEKLSVTENVDGTTSISYDFGKLYNNTSVRLQFRIQARSNYIGGNNVYTNVGAPVVSYSHTSRQTGVTETYSLNGTDLPIVNVPVRFGTVNGGSATIKVGDSVNLADLSSAIVEDVEERIGAYDQINGTLTYSWKINGTETVTAQVTIVNGKIVSGELIRDNLFTGTDPGNYPGTLSVTFSPDTAKPESGVAVNPLTNTGNVTVKVVDATTKLHFTVKKVWENDMAGADFIQFRLLANGIQIDDTLYTLDAGNQWQMEFDNMPAVDRTGVPIEYAVVEERVDGFLPTYTTEIKYENTYAATATIRFVPKDDINADKSVVFTYTYGGETYTFVQAAREHEKYSKNVWYSIQITGLPVDENNQAYGEASVVSIISSDRRTTLSQEITVESVISGTVASDVFVITNSTTVKLPETGGAGMAGFVIAGGGLTTAAVLVLILEMRRERRKRKS